VRGDNPGDEKTARNRRIFEMWMACYTQEEIAERENVNKDTVNEICREMANSPKSDKALAEHAVNFDPPEAAGEDGVAHPPQVRHQSESKVSDKMGTYRVRQGCATRARRLAAGPWRFNQQRVPPTARRQPRLKFFSFVSLRRIGIATMTN
jgi:DNA-binding CsgD family transcriptional regulator